MQNGSILVVDDNLSHLFLMKSILYSEGLSADFVENGEGALQKLTEVHFKLMITDLNMPGMDGLELTRRAKKIIPSMPVIMITGANFADIPILAAEAGVTKLLYKPYTPESIMKAMYSVFAPCEEKQRNNSLQSSLSTMNTGVDMLMKTLLIGSK